MSRPLWTLLLLLKLTCLALVAESTPDLVDRLTTAAQLSTLSDATLKPWHLKIDFDLLDLKGTIREHGTLEESWAAPDRFRITVTSPSYTATETHNGDNRYRTAGQPRLPDLDDLIISQVNGPLHEIVNSEGISPLSEKRAFGKVDLDCIMPAPPADPRRRIWLGQYTTYCFDPEEPDLRVVIRYREQFILRNNVARFQKHDIPLDLSVLDAGKLVLKAHVAQLSTYTPGEHEFDLTSEQEVVASLPRFGSAFTAGRLVGKVNPLLSAAGTSKSH